MAEQSRDTITWNTHLSYLYIFYNNNNPFNFLVELRNVHYMIFSYVPTTTFTEACKWSFK